MPRRTTEDWDEDGPEEEEETMPCPYCKRPIHEDAQRCPYCENWISEEDVEASPEGKPTWIVLTALVCLLLVILWIFGH
jgi:hypothetical protein